MSAIPPRTAQLANQSVLASRSSTSLITPSVTNLSDPPPSLVDAHLVEFLTAEMIKVLVISEAAARARRVSKEKLVEADLVAMTLVSQTAALAVRDLPAATVSAEKVAAAREEADEGVRKRLDNMGFKVGWATAERLARDRLRFPTTVSPAGAAPSSSASTSLGPSIDALEAVKFICKDVWIALYDKQIDNLRTNHRGVYVLLDSSFKPLSRVSGAADDENVARRTKFFLAYPAGIIRGALATLGITCTVTGESTGLPSSTFQIKTTRAGAV